MEKIILLCLIVGIILLLAELSPMVRRSRRRDTSPNVSPTPPS